MILDLCHIIFWTCYKTELSGGSNDCFIIMHLRSKIVGVLSGQAPSPSPFASVTDWMLPSTPLKRCVFLKYNCTKTLQWVARLQRHLKDALFKLALVIDTSMKNHQNHNNHVKRLDHCLCRVVWPEQQEFSWVGPAISRRKNQANSRGKSCLLLHHWVLSFWDGFYPTGI